MQTIVYQDSLLSIFLINMAQPNKVHLGKLKYSKGLIIYLPKDFTTDSVK